MRLGSVVLHVSDLERAGAFWSSALGYTRSPANPAFLGPASGDGVRLHLDDGDRTHLDLWTDSRAEQLAEVDRLVALGARRVEWVYPEGADFIVLADPEGNLFCVIA